MMASPQQEEEEPSTRQQMQFVFGYGSLISSHSRARTNPCLVKKKALPVLVHNVQRSWCKRTPFFTAMGVELIPGAQCTGVVIPVSDTELENFDQRERNYTRRMLDLSMVRKVPFLKDELYNDMTFSASDDSYPTALLLQAMTENNNNDDTIINSDIHKSFQIWMYVPDQMEPPTIKSPICQSYVDTILRGCLEISDEFAIDFIQNTKGWTLTDFYVSENDNHNDNKEDNTNVFWLDDRDFPNYFNGDHEYNVANRDYHDDFLRKHRKNEFLLRSSLP